MTNFITVVVCSALIYFVFKISDLLEKRIDKIERVESTGIVQGWRTDLNFFISLALVCVLFIRAIISARLVFISFFH